MIILITILILKKQIVMEKIKS